MSYEGLWCDVEVTWSNLWDILQCSWEHFVSKTKRFPRAVRVISKPEVTHRR